MTNINDTINEQQEASLNKLVAAYIVRNSKLYRPENRKAELPKDLQEQLIVKVIKNDPAFGMDTTKDNYIIYKGGSSNIFEIYQKQPPATESVNSIYYNYTYKQIYTLKVVGNTLKLYSPNNETEKEREKEEEVSLLMLAPILSLTTKSSIHNLCPTDDTLKLYNDGVNSSIYHLRFMN